MKPRAEPPNAYKRMNQELKAARLTLAIEDLAEQSKMSALEVFGRLRTEKQWTLLLMVADPRVLAGEKKPEPPSAATQLIILSYLRERSQAQGAA